MLLFVLGGCVLRRGGALGDPLGGASGRMVPEEIHAWQYTLSDMFLVSFAVSLSLATATMSPGPADDAGFCSLPEIVNNWLKRSRLLLLTL